MFGFADIYEDQTNQTNDKEFHEVANNIINLINSLEAQG